MRRFMLLGALAGLFAAAAPAYAGELYAFRTTITPTGAQGVIGSARAWNDQGPTAIYCGLEHTGSNVRGFCAGWVGADATVCNTTNPRMLDAIRMLGPQSHLQFTVDATGLCTEITVTTASWYGPARP
jgi:hypothetical protein